MDDRDERVWTGSLGGQADPKGFTLEPADYAEGCVKAALALLMKPNRTDDDVKKAHAWLGLAIEKNS